MFGIAHRRRGRGEVDLARAGVARHLHDLLRGGAAHDRVVDQQHHAVAEFQRDRIELAAHRLRALALPRHDEGAADVAVLDEALAVLHAEHVGDLQRGVARGVGDRDHRVDVVVRAQAQDLLAELLAHAHARLVHRDVVHHRVGAREVDVLEDAGRVLPAARRTAAVNSSPRAVTTMRLARARRRAGARSRACRARPIRRRPRIRCRPSVVALAEHQRADAVRIAERDQAQAQHRARRPHSRPTQRRLHALDGA